MYLAIVQSAGSRGLRREGLRHGDKVGISVNVKLRDNPISVFWE